MKRIIQILIFISLFWNGLMASAQPYYTIPDPNFRDYLDKNFSYLLNTQKQLNIASASSFTWGMTCMDLGIKDLSGIEYFTSMTMFNCSRNPLKQLPQLSALKGLKNLWAEECQLTTLPEINQLKNLLTFDVKNNNLAQLPGLSGMTSLQYFDCSINQIKSLPDLSDLTSLESFYCYKNSIATIPSVQNLTRLKIFDFSYNNLTAIPDLSKNTALVEVNVAMNFITALPSLTTLINLERLFVYNNNLTKLPELPSGNKLTLVNAAKNKLTTIPDLSGKTSLTVAAFDHNQLSFSDIIPQLQHPSFSSVFIFNPQDTIKSFVQRNVVTGQTVTISAERDALIKNNNFYWKKNGITIDTTQVNFIVLDSVKKEESGDYIAEVTNNTSGLGGLKLVIRTVSLNVVACGPSSSSYNYNVASNTCVDGATILIDQTDLAAQNAPYKFQVVSSGGVFSGWNSKGEISNLKPGIYDLNVRDKNDCQVVLQKYIQVPNAEDCDNVITPNGDGVGDYYAVQATGKVKIYDKSLKLVKEFSGPGMWDGTNSNGEVVPIGLYIIVVNDKDKINILVLN